MSYTKIALAKPFEGEPVINMPSCYGASPGKPILFKIPVTGKRPITYTVLNLPDGLTVSNDIITGKIDTEGNYTLTLVAENSLGKSKKELTLEIYKDRVQLTPCISYAIGYACVFWYNVYRCTTGNSWYSKI